MSITSKIAAALLITFAALVGAAWLILQTSVRPSFERQEMAAHELNRARVEANLAAVADGMRARVLDYARWDDSYRFFQGRNSTYISTNFISPHWLRDYGADLAIFLDNEGRPLWSRQRNGDTTTSAQAGVISAAFTQVRVLDGVGALTGTLWTDAPSPIIFAAARATRSDGTGTPIGYVIYGRYLDPTVLAQQTQLDVEITTKAGAARTWTRGDHLYSLIPLTDAHGDTIIGGVVAHSDRTFAALGASSIEIATTLLAFVFAAALFAVWFSLRHVVVARLQRMERHFSAQADTATPIAPDHGNDEIAGLTAAYNALAERVAQADARTRAAILEREAAAAANRMKSDFLANISYELRTPLNDVIGYADLIGEDLADRGDTSAEPDLNRITDAARNMLSMLTELLDLSRIEADRLEINAESFEVEEVFLSAAAAARSSALGHNADLRVVAPHNLGQATTDQNRLRQCILNTLTHASRRSHGGAFSFRAARTHDTLSFEIHDCGRALTPAQMSGLFEPFLREDDERLSGARLGLAVTRKLAELMGGSFEVSQLDTGCRYVLTVPAYIDANRIVVHDDTPLARSQRAAA